MPSLHPPPPRATAVIAWILEFLSTVDTVSRSIAYVNIVPLTPAIGW